MSTYIIIKELMLLDISSFYDFNSYYSPCYSSSLSTQSSAFLIHFAILTRSLTLGQISGITDRIIPVIKEWQGRPLEAVYPIVFLDGMYCKARINRERSEAPL